MILCVVLLALYFFFLKEKYPQLTEYNTVFWLESIALWAFGTSWLVKGQLVMKDRPKLGKEALADVTRIFDEDLVALGALLGIEINCANFKDVARETTLPVSL